MDLWPAIRACGRFPGRFPYGAGDWEGLLAAGVLRLVQGLVRPFRAEMNGGELRSWKVLAVGDSVTDQADRLPVRGGRVLGKQEWLRVDPKPEHCRARLAGASPASRWGPWPDENSIHFPARLASRARECSGSGAVENIPVPAKFSA